MRYKKRTAFLFLLPTLIGLIVFRLGPIFVSFFASFTRWSVFSPPKWIGLANYKEAFSSDIFWLILKNTMLFALLYVPGVMIISLFMAMLINNKVKGITFFRGLFYLPVITSTVAIGVVWSWILSPKFGIIYQILKNLGVRDVPSFLGDSKYALLSLIFVYIWKMAGYQMILYLAGLQNIPSVYYEAASIDGASPWQMFKKITLPLLSPTTFFVLIISLIQSLQTFDITYTMTQGGPNHASSTLVFYIYVNAFKHFRMGYASAMSYILLLFAGIITLINFKFKNKWVHYAE